MSCIQIHWILDYYGLDSLINKNRVISINLFYKFTGLNPWHISEKYNSTKRKLISFITCRMFVVPVFIIFLRMVYTYAIYGSRCQNLLPMIDILIFFFTYSSERKKTVNQHINNLFFWWPFTYLKQLNTQFKAIQTFVFNLKYALIFWIA